MFVPSPYQQVRVAGHTGIFRVLSTDLMTQTAGLVRLDHIAPLLHVVPFSDLQPYEPENAPHAA